MSYESEIVKFFGSVAAYKAHLLAKNVHDALQELAAGRKPLWLKDMPEVKAEVERIRGKTAQERFPLAA
ncbi:MAG: hypothetical protein WAX89_03250 [Alphaproteobacteria bacterium]